VVISRKGSMKSEKIKMLSGDSYNAMDFELVAERQAAKTLIFDLNNLHPDELLKRKEILVKLLGKTKNTFNIESPFHCDYGYNIEIGENFFANYNLIILDCARVTIGDNVMIGPNVSLYTAGHPVQSGLRWQGIEYALPIIIEDNVWIGGNVVINPGVLIGKNSVIGSGSVVTRNIPENMIAYGNPCKPVRGTG
jgi:acetyltransferase-like isoleucine patch superfamily enzyme